MPKNPTSTPSGTVSIADLRLGDVPAEDTLIQEAARIDAARVNQEKQNPVDQVIDNDAAAAAEAAEPKPAADPIMVMSLTMLVSSGIRVLHTKYDWTEPGDVWKTNVATLGATIIDRYIPLLMAGQTEVIALLLLVGPYVVENLIRTAGRSSSDPGTEGQRKDNVIEPLAEEPITRFPHPA